MKGAVTLNKENLEQIKKQGYYLYSPETNENDLPGEKAKQEVILILPISSLYEGVGFVIRKNYDNEYEIEGEKYITDINSLEWNDLTPETWAKGEYNRFIIDEGRNFIFVDENGDKIEPEKYL